MQMRKRLLVSVECLRQSLLRDDGLGCTRLAYRCCSQPRSRFERQGTLTSHPSRVYQRKIAPQRLSIRRRLPPTLTSCTWMFDMSVRPVSIVASSS
ncbi:hypothetical protein P280DRAFT_321957 [Massarina eburnea CBS 473.64]|uniref:Uncharacterized protein n=1 Tax=Massarina eburnea CBS 473.64 TaxID=1395130 RepID=A0A6A6RYE1_9PLEO|nr:hypothetical protein P280DRAFT_321957 [Massarina eburnea CBS 473.64]